MDGLLYSVQSTASDHETDSDDFSSFCTDSYNKYEL